MCICIHTSIHTHIRTHTHTHGHTHTHIYIHTDIHTYTQTYTHRHTDTQTHRQAETGEWNKTLIRKSENVPKHEVKVTVSTLSAPIVCILQRKILWKHYPVRDVSTDFAGSPRGVLENVFGDISIPDDTFILSKK